MEARIAALEKRIRTLTHLVATLVTLLIVLVVVGFTRNSQNQIVRARGIVIVDDHGRDRILIGAPIPESKDRLRTDLRRVRQTWARRFPSPEQYMTYYQNYRHTVHGILVMDQNGVDRVAVGDSAPDPNIGRRIGPATGIVINDSQGFERSGYSLLTVAGKDRVVLGLDSNRGSEGLALSLFDDGSHGLSVYAGKNQAFFGFMPGDSTTPALTGLILSNERTIVHRVALDSAGSVHIR